MTTTSSTTAAGLGDADTQLKQKHRAMWASGHYDTVAREVMEEAGVPDWQGMVQQLVAGHEACARTAREAFQRADGADDQPTADLATTRMQAHEKTAWMLRSLLQ